VARAQAPAAAVKADPQATAGCNPTVSGCLFCGSKGYCAALAKFALKVGHKYSPVQVPENVTPSLLVESKHAKQSMEVAQLLEAWGKAVRAQITARAIEDDAWLPDGYRLRTRATNEVVSSRGVLKLAREAGVKGKALAECLDVRLTPLNQAIRDLAERGQKTEAEDTFRERMVTEKVLEQKTPSYFLERLKT
jgi:hypothetical protein